MATSTTTIPPTSAPSWLAAVTLAERELVRFFRQKNRVFGALGQPIIFWLLFSEGLKGNDLDYTHFFPGTLVMILLFTAIFATISIIEDRREGFLQSVLVAPAPRWAMVAGKIGGGAAIAMLQALLFLALGWFTLPLESSFFEILQAVILMGVIAVALTSLGFLLAWRMDSTAGFHAIMSVFLLPMWLLSGAFFPAGSDGVLGWIVRINPLTYGVSGLRHYLRFASENSAAATEPLASLPLCWIVSLAFAAIMFAASWKIAATRSTGDLL
ncbi:ABC transporter permease [Adhaeretor mobilis]|uniref:Transport permease protein n=1 Tax=Adhaeretor mobilis TaxID=1930276 RepID=A0A517MZ81_9BACT|nr:ABC transporter permease [Adhaeretor mobilis]QDT00175.1 ABC-2 type transporter [Adhaeretor mobilis]